MPHKHDVYEQALCLRGRVVVLCGMVQQVAYEGVGAAPQQHQVYCDWWLPKVPWHVG